MTNRESALDRAAAGVMDLDSPAYGDERERAVFMEAGHFGLTIGLYLGLFVALASSIFGLILLPTVLLIVTVLPSLATHWYARRRGVDINALAERSGARSTLVSIMVACTVVALTFAGMAYTVFAGQPLVPSPPIDVTPGEGVLGGMAEGAVVGGVLGGLAGIGGALFAHRKAKQNSAADQELPPASRTAADRE